MARPIDDENDCIISGEISITSRAFESTLKGATGATTAVRMNPMGKANGAQAHRQPN
jgi:hypothetical protein